jgi:ribonuclease-3 family protein
MGDSIPSLSEFSQLSPASLAYIGDAVYELYVRAYYLLPPRRVGEYHRQVVAQVRAEQQAAYLNILAPDLTEAEREIVRRGRNAATGKPKRLPLHIYQQATSLETLIGYLYLRDPQRLNQLLAKISLDF